jgi:hypothetical protein
MADPRQREWYSMLASEHRTSSCAVTRFLIAGGSHLSAFDFEIRDR